MGRVILGAILGTLLGGLIGGWPTYRDATVQVIIPVQAGTHQQVISFDAVLRGFSLIIGVSTGAIVGAIAGGVSASPGSKPVGVWLWVVLLVVVAILVLGAFVYWLLPSGMQERQPQQNIPVPAPEAITKPIEASKTITFKSKVP